MQIFRGSFDIKTEIPNMSWKPFFSYMERNKASEETIPFIIARWIVGV